MTELRIPRLLAEFAARHDELGIRAWVGTLPVIVPELADRWALSLGEPYDPGGMGSWVAPARRSNGEDVVLKVGWRHFEADHEADGLRFWNGDGVVHVYAAQAFDHTSAVLLERCEPGDTLASVLPEQEHDVVVAGLLRRLWQHPPDGHPFRELATMCDAWADEFEEKVAAAPGFVDAGLAREGMALFRELPRTAADAVLLCTDLHAENILAARREPWLVIDPKPYLGDPAYDPLQHMLNPRGPAGVRPGGLQPADGRPARSRREAAAAVAVRPERAGMLLVAGAPRRGRPAGAVGARLAA